MALWPKTPSPVSPVDLQGNLSRVWVMWMEALTRALKNLINAALTPSRLVASDASGSLTSVSNLASWIAGTSQQITVANDGDGTITLSLPDDVLIPGVLTVPNAGLHLLDTNASHDFIIKPGSDLTADRILTITTGDAARTVTLNGNPTLDDWFDQAVKQASSPTFADLTLSAPVNIYSLSHDSFAGFVADEHVAHAGVTLTAGAGMTGGGDISANRTFAVGAGTGIAVAADAVSLSHLGLEALTDPGGDRIVFWDESENAAKWLAPGNSVAITATTLDTIQDIRTSASPLFVALTLSNGQIVFPATQVASSGANTLDDYEEGTFTPGLAFGGASVDMTYNSSYRNGSYTKIGRLVTVTGVIVLTAKGSSVGDATITGLPFAVASGSSYYGVPSLMFNRVTFANQSEGRFSPGATTIDLYEITEAGVVSALTNADFADNSEVYFTATYFSA